MRHPNSPKSDQAGTSNNDKNSVTSSYFFISQLYFLFCMITEAQPSQALSKNGKEHYTPRFHKPKRTKNTLKNLH